LPFVDSTINFTYDFQQRFGVDIERELDERGRAAHPFERCVTYRLDQGSWAATGEIEAGGPSLVESTRSSASGCNALNSYGA
jgi:hypothetical protein